MAAWRRESDARRRNVTLAIGGDVYVYPGTRLVILLTGALGLYALERLALDVRVASGGVSDSLVRAPAHSSASLGRIGAAT